jgi:hypothetical protein
MEIMGWITQFLGLDVQAKHQCHQRAQQASAPATGEHHPDMHEAG